MTQKVPTPNIAAAKNVLAHLALPPVNSWMRLTLELTAVGVLDWLEGLVAEAVVDVVVGVVVGVSTGVDWIASGSGVGSGVVVAGATLGCGAGVLFVATGAAAGALGAAYIATTTVCSPSPM